MSVRSDSEFTDSTSCRGFTIKQAKMKAQKRSMLEMQDDRSWVSLCEELNHNHMKSLFNLLRL